MAECGSGWSGARRRRPGDSLRSTAHAQTTIAGRRREGTGIMAAACEHKQMAREWVLQHIQSIETWPAGLGKGPRRPSPAGQDKLAG